MRSAAAIEERLLFPAYASRWSSLTVAAHRMLALPLQLKGPVRRRIVETGGREVTLLEIGRAKLTESLCAQLFEDLPIAEDETSHSLRHPQRVAGSAQIVVAEVHRWIAPRFRRAGWIIVPDRVRWQADIDHLPPPSPSHSLKDDLRKVRSRGYMVEHAGTPGGLGGVRRRDGGAAGQRPLRRGGVASLDLSAAAVRAAGPAALHRTERPASRRLLLGPHPATRCGCRSPACATAIRRCCAPACRWRRTRSPSSGLDARAADRVDLGRTSPFFHDGVQQYKRKWGFDPVSRPAGAPHRGVGGLRCRAARVRPSAGADRARGGPLALRRRRPVTAALPVPGSRWAAAPLEGAAALPEAEWNGLARRGFHLQAWFRAAEESGWRAQHVVVRDGPEVCAVVPAYLTGGETPHDLHERWLGPLRGLERIGLGLRPVLSVQSPFSLTSDILGDTGALPHAVLGQVFDLLEEAARPGAGQGGGVALRGWRRRRADRPGARPGLRGVRRGLDRAAPDLVGLVRRVRRQPPQVGAAHHPGGSRRAGARRTRHPIHG